MLVIIKYTFNSHIVCALKLHVFQWLVKKIGKDEWELSLSVNIKNIVIDSILCSQEGVIAGRRGCWEVYGFDIMIDENYNPWLIEVNSSPACDYSTPVTEAFVKKALPDVLKVVLDDSKTHQHPVNTGGWDCIYCGETIPKVAAGFGIDMLVKGEKLSLKRPRKKIKIKNKGRDPCSEEKYDLIFNDSDLSDYEQKNRHANIRSDIELDKENQDIKDNSTVIVDQKILQQPKKKNPVQKIIVPLKKITLGF